MHIHRTSATLIDNIFVNDPGKLHASGNIFFLILMIISHSSVLQRQQKINFNKLKICDYSRFSADRFNNELSEVDWNRIIANKLNCVNKLFHRFTTSIVKLFTNTSP